LDACYSFTLGYPSPFVAALL